MKIVGIAGKAGCGKNTGADLLTAEYGYEQESFATPLKNMLAAKENNMQIPHLQSLISRTKNEINSLHEEALAAKGHRNHLYEKAGNIVGCYEADWQQRAYLQGLADEAHKAYEKATKQIAKLALLQKACKKELYHTLLDEAFLKTLTEHDDLHMFGGMKYE